MSEFVVHGIIGSPYVRAALMGFEEKGGAYRLEPVKVGESRTPDYLARQPFGRVPVVEHGDFRLYETQAILRYLDRLHPEPPFLPADPRLEARANQIAGIVDWYVMPAITADITFQRLVAPKLDIPVDEARVAKAIPKAKVCMATLSGLLGEQPFMAGEALSIADLIAAPHLEFFTHADESRAMFAAHPNLARWLERMEQRPSMIATGWKALAEKAAA